VPPYIERAPAEIAQAAGNTAAGENLRLMIRGTDSVGNKREWMVQLPVGAEKTGAEKVAALGLKLRQDGAKVLIDDVGFDSKAKKAGLDWDQEILVVLRPNDQPSKYWMFIPALVLLGGVVLLQRRRTPTADAAVGAASKA
jgi:predicted metalloprotease with PDZ domain